MTMYERWATQDKNSLAQTEVFLKIEPNTALLHPATPLRAALGQNVAPPFNSMDGFCLVVTLQLFPAS